MKKKITLTGAFARINEEDKRLSLFFKERVKNRMRMNEQVMKKLNMMRICKDKITTRTEIPADT